MSYRNRKNMAALRKTPPIALDEHVEKALYLRRSMEQDEAQKASISQQLETTLLYAERSHTPLQKRPDYYPPALTGLRGSHPGSNDHAHARAWTGRSDWGPTTLLGEEYDLVVVGGGLI